MKKQIKKSQFNPFNLLPIVFGFIAILSAALLINDYKTTAEFSENEVDGVIKDSFNTGFDRLFCSQFGHSAFLYTLNCHESLSAFCNVSSFVDLDDVFHDASSFIQPVFLQTDLNKYDYTLDFILIPKQSYDIDVRDDVETTPFDFSKLSLVTKEFTLPLLKDNLVSDAKEGKVTKDEKENEKQKKFLEFEKDGKVSMKCEEITFMVNFDGSEESGEETESSENSEEEVRLFNCRISVLPLQSFYIEKVKDDFETFKKHIDEVLLNFDVLNYYTLVREPAPNIYLYDSTSLEDDSDEGDENTEKNNICKTIVTTTVHSNSGDETTHLEDEIDIDNAEAGRQNRAQDAINKASEDPTSENIQKAKEAINDISDPSARQKQQDALDKIKQDAAEKEDNDDDEKEKEDETAAAANANNNGGNGDDGGDGNGNGDTTQVDENGNPDFCKDKCTRELLLENKQCLLDQDDEQFLAEESKGAIFWKYDSETKRCKRDPSETPPATGGEKVTDETSSNIVDELVEGYVENLNLIDTGETHLIVRKSDNSLHIRVDEVKHYLTTEEKLFKGDQEILRGVTYNRWPRHDYISFNMPKESGVYEVLFKVTTSTPELQYQKVKLLIYDTEDISKMFNEYKKSKTTNYFDDLTENIFTLDYVKQSEKSTKIFSDLDNFCSRFVLSSNNDYDTCTELHSLLKKNILKN